MILLYSNKIVSRKYLCKYFNQFFMKDFNDIKCHKHVKNIVAFNDFT